ncbi:MAG: monovalent cation/H(+) antiporter subunit G [Thermaurantiacus sp.]
MIDLAATFLIGVGLLFFAAGTVGLLRFPDVFSRLHALTKADNLGLGFIVLGVALLLGDGWSAFKLFLVWMLAVLAAATVAQLIARAALERDRHR